MLLSWQVIQGNPSGIKEQDDQSMLPRLVYVSREKRPSHPHHFKAGAVNTLVSLSLSLSLSLNDWKHMLYPYDVLVVVVAASSLWSDEQFSLHTLPRLRHVLQWSDFSTTSLMFPPWSQNIFLSSFRSIPSKIPQHCQEWYLWKRVKIRIFGIHSRTQVLAQSVLAYKRRKYLLREMSEIPTFWYQLT